MKRLMIALTLVLSMAVSVNAMSYSDARDQALYLTDKMAYELNLSVDQYNACFEINLDYLMSVNLMGDILGPAWTLRNTELGYVLTVAQYQALMEIEYFIRPLTWLRNKPSLLVVNYYPKNRYYREAPAGYLTYRGGNSYYGYSPYKGRNYNVDPGRGPRPGYNNFTKGSSQPVSHGVTPPTTHATTPTATTTSHPTSTRSGAGAGSVNPGNNRGGGTTTTSGSGSGTGGTNVQGSVRGGHTVTSTGTGGTNGSTRPGGNTGGNSTKGSGSVNTSSSTKSSSTNTTAQPQLTKREAVNQGKVSMGSHRR